MNTQKIAIIGYGELGKAIHKLLKNKSDLIVDIWDKKYHESKLSGVISSANIIFICVPSWCVRGALERIKKGDVLVCGMTLPDYVPAMKKAAAIVTNEGGLRAMQLFSQEN
mgnify:CR=1 FL=1